MSLNDESRKFSVRRLIRCCKTLSTVFFCSAIDADPFYDNNGMFAAQQPARLGRDDEFGSLLNRHDVVPSIGAQTHVVTV